MPVVTSGVGTYTDKHNFSSWFRSWCADNGFGHWEDDEGRRIVDLELGVDDASGYAGCVIEWRDAVGWPCDENGRRYSRSYKRPALKRHYNGLVYHELRHTHFTLRLDHGTSIPVAMALGGWKSSRMLYETYVHATPERIWDEADFMDSVLSASKNE